MRRAPRACLFIVVQALPSLVGVLQPVEPAKSSSGVCCASATPVRELVCGRACAGPRALQRGHAAPRSSCRRSLDGAHVVDGPLRVLRVDADLLRASTAAASAARRGAVNESSCSGPLPCATAPLSHSRRSQRNPNTNPSLVLTSVSGTRPRCSCMTLSRTARNESVEGMYCAAAAAARRSRRSSMRGGRWHTCRQPAASRARMRAGCRRGFWLGL